MKAKLKNKITGDEVELSLSPKLLGYSNEMVIADTFGYGKAESCKHPYYDKNNWEIKYVIEAGDVVEFPKQ